MHWQLVSKKHAIPILHSKPQGQKMAPHDNTTKQRAANWPNDSGTGRRQVEAEGFPVADHHDRPLHDQGDLGNESFVETVGARPDALRETDERRTGQLRGAAGARRAKKGPVS